MQAALLMYARVIVLSNGDEKLVRVLLPQILDLALRESLPSAVLGCAAYALAHISVACARNSCRWRCWPMLMHHARPGRLGMSLASFSQSAILRSTSGGLHTL